MLVGRPEEEVARLLNSPDNGWPGSPSPPAHHALSSCLRLPVYYKCNSMLENATNATLKQLICSGGKKKTGNRQTNGGNVYSYNPVGGTNSTTPLNSSMQVVEEQLLLKTNGCEKKKPKQKRNSGCQQPTTVKFREENGQLLRTVDNSGGNAKGDAPGTAINGKADEEKIVAEFPDDDESQVRVWNL